MKSLALYNLKYDSNFGSILRIAYNFEVDCIYIIGNSKKFNYHPMDIFKTTYQIPTIYIKTFEEFLNSYAPSNRLVSLEVNNSISLEEYIHPKNAIYMLGGESTTLPINIPNCDRVIIPTQRCLNVAMATAITLYDRESKRGK